jgi:hypothetical protein
MGASMYRSPRRASFLGRFQVRLATTNVSAEIRLELRAKTSANREVDGKASGKSGKEDAGLMEFLADRLINVVN